MSVRRFATSPLPRNLFRFIACRRESTDTGSHRCKKLLWSASLIAVGACSPDITLSPSEGSDQVSVSQPSRASAAAGAIRTIDMEFADLADSQLPGFGGLYYDEDGVPVVYLKDTSRVSTARERVRAFLARGALGNGSRLGEIDRAISGLRVRSARYDYRELYDWYSSRLIPMASTLRGLVMTDIDERQNRIVIGISQPSEIAAARSKIAALGIPPGAFDVVHYPVRAMDAPLAVENCDPIFAIIPCDEQGPSGTNFQINSTHRPVVGALQLGYQTIEGSFICSIGFNIAHRYADGTLDPEKYFVTASHCGEQGIMTGLFMGQSTISELVAGEEADPSLVSSAIDPACPIGRLCRYSDAALYKYFPGVGVLHGGVAFPGIGSLTVVENRSVVGAGDPIVGMAVHKIGRTTGRTVGVVQQACVNMQVFKIRDGQQVDTGRTMLCQAEASYESAEGDSGGPVVEVWPDGTLVARGIHWRGGGGFSPMNSALQELRTVTGGGLGPTVTDGM